MEKIPEGFQESFLQFSENLLNDYGTLFPGSLTKKATKFQKNLKMFFSNIYEVIHKCIKNQRFFEELKEKYLSLRNFQIEITKNIENLKAENRNLESQISFKTDQLEEAIEEKDYLYDRLKNVQDSNVKSFEWWKCKLSSIKLLLETHQSGKALEKCRKLLEKRKLEFLDSFIFVERGSPKTETQYYSSTKHFSNLDFAKNPSSKKKSSNSKSNGENIKLEFSKHLKSSKDLTSYYESTKEPIMVSEARQSQTDRIANDGNYSFRPSLLEKLEEIDPERDSVESSILKNVLNKDSTERMLRFPLKAFKEEEDEKEELSFSKKLKTEGDDDDTVIYTEEEPMLKLNEIVSNRTRSKTIYIQNVSPKQSKPKYGYSFVEPPSNDTEKKISKDNSKGTLRGKHSLNSQNLKGILRMLTSSLERSDAKAKFNKRKFLSPKNSENKENTCNNSTLVRSKGKLCKGFPFKLATRKTNMQSICGVASEHKTRVCNVIWQWLKLYVSVAIIAYLDSQLEKKECSQDGKVLRQLAFTGSIAFLILVTGGGLYVAFRKRFARLEFFLLYIIQGAWNLVLLAYSIYLLIKGSGCQMLFLLEKSLIILIIKTEVQVQTLLWAPRQIALLHVNCCTNILWPVLFLSATTATCAKSNTTLVLGITFFTIFFSFVSFGISIANFFVKGVQRLKRATFFFYVITAFISGGLILASYSEKSQFLSKKNGNRNCTLFHIQMHAYISAEPLNFLGLLFLLIYTLSSWEKNASNDDDFPEIKSLKFVQEVPYN